MSLVRELMKDFSVQLSGGRLAVGFDITTSSIRKHLHGTKIVLIDFDKEDRLNPFALDTLLKDGPDALPRESRLFITTNILDFSFLPPRMLENKLTIIRCPTVFGPDGDLPADSDFIQEVKKNHLSDLLAWILE
jgi:hypothetical protein